VGELSGVHGPGQLEARERRPLRAQRRPGRRAAHRALRDRRGRRHPARCVRLASLPGRGGAAAKRKLSGQATWWFGGFYTGRLDQIELEASWTPSPIVTLLVNAERDIGRLDEGDIDLTLVGPKVRLNLSPDLQLDSFLQYDTEERTFGTNTRLRWTFDPRGGLFLIYNHNLREVQDRWRRDANELLVKLQYTFRR
jgi:hypothetical protein